VSRISELEGVVLGIVGRQDRCTAHQVRRALLASPSTYWSASAGAIYPLLSRLRAAGHVASNRDRADGRGRSHLSLTAKGRRALRSWLLQASDASIAASIFDAVRSRAFFLGSLSARDRERFAEGALRALEGFLEVALTYERARDDDATRLERLAANGAVRVARARVEWMRELREAVRSA
jgi:DNA-binding PadR family transcriptional regulator